MFTTTPLTTTPFTSTPLTAAASAPSTVSPATKIDMFTPAQVGEQLQLDDDAILRLVNSGTLAAYNLGGAIRFKKVDVAAAARQLLAA